MVKQLRLYILLFVLLIAAGCASVPKYRPELPEDIGNKGLVVGEVVGVGYLSNWSDYKDVLINNRTKGKVVNGLIAIPLSPGEYSFDGLYTETYGGSSTFNNVTVTTKNTKTMPVKKPFTVRPKEVTNLGLLILYPDPQDKEMKKFVRFFLDNRTDMKHFLRYSYPTLAPKVKIDAMTLAPGALMPDNLLQLLRKELLTTAANMSVGNPGYLAANVGTLAEIQRDKDGKPSGVKMIDLPTLASIDSVSPSFVKDRIAFLTNNNRLFVAQNGKAAEKRPPQGLRAGRVYAFGASDLIIVDDHLEIYLSNDNGDRWVSYTGSVTKDEVSPQIAIGKNGYYAYTGKPNLLIYSEYGKTEFSPIQLPQDLKKFGMFNEKSIGSFAEEALTFYKETEKRPFYFRPTGSTVWQKQFMPAPNCEHIKFADGDGANMSTVCSDRAVGFGGQKFMYISKDGGVGWQRK